MTDDVRKGDCGGIVRELQNIAADGRFGPATDAAVRDFQRTHGLTVDGQVGPNTWAAMSEGGLGD